MLIRVGPAKGPVMLSSGRQIVEWFSGNSLIMDSIHGRGNVAAEYIWCAEVGVFALNLQPPDELHLNEKDIDRILLVVPGTDLFWDVRREEPFHKDERRFRWAA